MEPQVMAIVNAILLCITIPGLIQAVLYNRIYLVILHSFTIGINFTIISLHLINRLQ